MISTSRRFAEKLLQKGFLTDSQVKSLREYQSLGIFSLRNELLFFNVSVGFAVYLRCGRPYL